ncbi:MAG: Beta-glucosidase BoGH3B [Acidimicrobiales bacterium]|nr:Beta-glucosidase BoGH3B [Acidimicrobiales bacterium]
MTEILPYQDPKRPVPERVEDLLDRMTVAEKLAQLGCVWSTALVVDDRFDEDVAREVLRNGTGHVTRVGGSTGLRPAASARFVNDIQRVLVEGTRLGVPAIVHEEAVAGFCARDATQFPQAIGLASTWDPDLLEAVGDVIRRQMMAVGARLTLSPVLDIGRDPRWGRVEETYGEDPYLAGRLGVAYVRGVQTGELANGVAATGKHFLGYGLPEGGMNHAPVQLGPRELREVFAEPFAAAIRDAGLATMMNSYSSVDGLPCAGAPQVLTALLRDELGFDGVVVADYFSVELLQTHHRVAAGKPEAAATALSAGLDMELPALDCYSGLEEMLDEGRFPIDVVDRSVRRVLDQKFRLGLFEKPFVDESRAAQVYDTAEDRALARRAAAESLVMLSNDGTLPLAGDIDSLAVIGPAADDIRLLQGDYHYPTHAEIIFGDSYATSAAATAHDSPYLPEAGGAFAPGPHFVRTVTPLEGIRAASSATTTITHVRGCGVLADDSEDIDAAVQAAADASVAIVCVGGRSGLIRPCTVGEARDATDLGLTGKQHELVERIVATGTPTVVVLVSGRVHTLPWIAEHAAALLQAWLPGEEGGNAVADVLFGRRDPSGRLPVSIPRNVGQVPVYYRHRAGGGKSLFHLDYTDSPTTPLFCFGHGLSYTSFEYSDLEVDAATTDDPLSIAVTLTNSGDRAGTEVVQLYVRDEVASTPRPDKQLVGFHRVELGAGESRRVQFIVHPSQLAFYDPQMRFVVEPGALTVMVGASADDLRLERIVDITGEASELRQSSVVATEVRLRPLR